MRYMSFQKVPSHFLPPLLGQDGGLLTNHDLHDLAYISVLLCSGQQNKDLQLLSSKLPNRKAEVALRKLLVNSTGRVVQRVLRGIMEEIGKPNLADYFPLLKAIDPQGIQRRKKVHFKKMIDQFNDMIDQRLKDKRLPGSNQDNDVLDALLGINQEKNEVIERSSVPYLIMDLFCCRNTHNYNFS